MVRVDVDGLNEQAAETSHAIETPALPPQEMTALNRLHRQWQEALDALCAAAQALNGAENAARLGHAFRRNYLAKQVNGDGFGGLY